MSWKIQGDSAFSPMHAREDHGRDGFQQHGQNETLPTARGREGHSATFSYGSGRRLLLKRLASYPALPISVQEIFPALCARRRSHSRPAVRVAHHANGAIKIISPNPLNTNEGVYASRRYRHSVSARNGPRGRTANPWCSNDMTGQESVRLPAVVD